MSVQVRERSRIRWQVIVVLALVLLASLAASATDRAAAGDTTVIVQLRPGVDAAAGRALVEGAGGRVTGELPIVNGLAARLTPAAARELESDARVRAVSADAAIAPQGKAKPLDPKKIATAYNQSARTAELWKEATGKGIGVAVIDTGIAGDLESFRVSQSDGRSRVVQSVVTNPDAETATDTYGHGTHVAGIIAGNDGYRQRKDKLFGKYAGAAPDANLISVKVSDDEGDATVLDVIYGLQFVVDHKDDFGIRVVNLSLESTSAESYKTDPLDAAVEAAWFSGIVVVAAAGNRGGADDAVHHAPGNDPYVITVGAADDQGTKNIGDDAVTSWSSRGTTQDGFAKPDIYAPGARIVSNLAPDSAFASMCPSCVTDGSYIRAGGTSMAAPVVAGVVADVLQQHPTWTPDQVKGALLRTTRAVRGGRVVDAVKASRAGDDELRSNEDLAPSTLLSAADGGIDYTKSSWSKSSWRTAPEELTASWAKSSWSCDCSLEADGSVTPSRADWTKSTWSTDWRK